MGINVTAIDGMGAVTEPSPGTFATTGMNASKHMHFSRDFLNNAGVIKSTDMAVSENSPVGLSVIVAAGVANVLNSSFADNSLSQQKFFNVVNDGNVVVNINTNLAGNPRITSIFLQIDVLTTPDGSASNVASFVAVDGTAAASPTAPATPSNSVRLADITVASGAASIANAVIADKRPFSQSQKNSLNSGWMYANEVWEYVSATSLKISGVDLTSKYSVGMRVVLGQTTGGTKYFEIASVAFSTDTTITLKAYGVYTLANEAILYPKFSWEYAPAGFPATLLGGRLKSRTILSGSGTYTVPTGVKSLLIQAVGGGSGGGGGARSAGNIGIGSGGGAGSYAEIFILVPSATYAYAVGAGGAGGTAGNNNGSGGGATTIAGITANPGGVGLGMAAGSSILSSSGGAGGTATGGDLNVGGGGGGGAIRMSLDFGLSGMGGASFFGGGGKAMGGASTLSGDNAIAYGAGGSGGYAIGSNAAGGNGLAGTIIVWELY